MTRHLGALTLLLVLVALAGVVGWRVAVHEDEADAVVDAAPEDAAVAVEVAPIRSEVVRETRILNGTLESPARFAVAAKVGGRLERVLVDLGDPIEPDQVVAEIDDAEFVQAVMQAKAEVAVRRAEVSRAQTALNLAQRDFDRAQELVQRGIASESQLDETSAALESAKAALQLAEAQVDQAQAALELANIRLGYTTVRAGGAADLNGTAVRERLHDPGNTVQAGEPIVSVVALDPLRAVVSVTERDYPRLDIGQPATLTTDALPGETFDAEIVRIAPTFREASRQARVELRVDNADHRLKPGMFTRVRVVLREQHAETVVPLAAIAQRDGQDIVFVLAPGSDHVRLTPVRLGIADGERVQVFGERLEGRVVTIGQQLLEDGSRVNVHDPAETQVEALAERRGAAG